MVRLRGPSPVFHLPLSSSMLLSPIPLLLRARFDEQADAGHVAVRHVGAGLLAPGSLQTSSRGPSREGENPVFCLRRSGERCDVLSAKARRGCRGCGHPASRCARRERLDLGTAAIRGSCFGLRILPFSIPIPGIGPRRRCCWRPGLSWAFRVCVCCGVGKLRFCWWVGCGFAGCWCR